MEIAAIIFIVLLLAGLALTIVYFIKKNQAAVTPDPGTTPDSVDPGTGNDPNEPYQYLTVEEVNTFTAKMKKIEQLTPSLVGLIAFTTAWKAFLTPSLGSLTKTEFDDIAKGIRKASIRMSENGFAEDAPWAVKALKSRSMWDRLYELYKGGRVSLRSLVQYGMKKADVYIAELEKKGLPALAEEDVTKITGEYIYQAAVAANYALTAEAASKIAADRLAVMELTSFIDPLAILPDMLMLGGMALDHFNLGGWLGNKSTQDWMASRVVFDREQAQAYIDSVKTSTTPNLYYPEIVGPLTFMAMDGSLGDDIVGQIMTILISPDPLDSSNANPILIDILARMHYKTSIDGTYDNIEINLIDAFTYLTQTQYETLYEQAYDQLCVAKGGVLIQPPAGFENVVNVQCSFASLEDCHNAAPWTPTIGTGNDNSMYTEWRSNAWFQSDNNKITIINPGSADTSFNYATPPQGACISQDPSFHMACNTPIVLSEFFGLEKDSYLYYKYTRETGQCEMPELMCWALGMDDFQTGGISIPDPIDQAFSYHACGRNRTDALVDLSFPAGWLAVFITKMLVGQSVWTQMTSCLVQDPPCGIAADGAFDAYVVSDDPTKNDNKASVPN